MGLLLIIMSVLSIDMVVNNVLLTDRVHELEMKLRSEHYKENR